jgi:hypothetical protein
MQFRVKYRYFNAGRYDVTEIHTVLTARFPNGEC